MVPVGVLEPDAILALDYVESRAEYERLSAIAPTVPPLDAEGGSWQDRTVLAGRMLGREQQAMDLAEQPDRTKWSEPEAGGG